MRVGLVNESKTDVWFDDVAVSTSSALSPAANGRIVGSAGGGVVKNTMPCFECGDRGDNGPIDGGTLPEVPIYPEPEEPPTPPQNPIPDPVDPTNPGNPGGGGPGSGGNTPGGSGPGTPGNPNNDKNNDGVPDTSGPGDPPSGSPPNPQDGDIHTYTDSRGFKVVLTYDAALQAWVLPVVNVQAVDAAPKTNLYIGYVFNYTDVRGHSETLTWNGSKWVSRQGPSYQQREHPEPKPCSTTAQTNGTTATYVYTNPAWTTTLNLLKGTVMNGYPREQGAALQANIMPDGNNTYANSYFDNEEGHATGVSVHTICQPVANGTYTRSIAQVHTHPEPAGTDNYMPPSGADVVNLAQRTTECAEMKDSYILAKDGSVYALHVQDRLKAMAFASSQGNNVDANNMFKEGTTIGDAFLDVQAKFIGQGFFIDDAFAMATAYVLEKYNAGITLLKLDGSSFKEMHVEEDPSKSGNKKYKGTICM